jgi:hypothetical protein
LLRPFGGVKFSPPSVLFEKKIFAISILLLWPLSSHTRYTISLFIGSPVLPLNVLDIVVFRIVSFRIPGVSGTDEEEETAMPELLIIGLSELTTNI